MKINDENVTVSADKFLSHFVEFCTKTEIPYMDIFLGFVFASKSVSKFMVGLDILSESDINCIEEEMGKAAESYFESNFDSFKCELENEDG